MVQLTELNLIINKMLSFKHMMYPQVLSDEICHRCGHRRDRFCCRVPILPFRATHQHLLFCSVKKMAVEKRKPNFLQPSQAQFRTADPRSFGMALQEDKYYITGVPSGTESIFLNRNYFSNNTLVAVVCPPFLRRIPFFS